MSAIRVQHEDIAPSQGLTGITGKAAMLAGSRVAPRCPEFRPAPLGAGLGLPGPGSSAPGT